MATGRHARFVTLGGLALLAGCSSPTSTPAYVRPKLSPLQITVTTDPPPDSDGNVVRDAILHIGFDDYPDPDTISFGPILLRSGTASFDADMRVDLVDKQVIVHPRSLLAPDTQYEVVVGADVRSLSGRTVESTMAAPIPVGEMLNPSPTPAAPTPTWDDVKQYIGDGCAQYCHTTSRCPGSMPPTRNPTIGLNLSKPTDPTVGLINVPSQLTAGTDHTLMRVQPGDASRSMLMRKLLGGDPNTGIARYPAPGMCMYPPEPEPANLGVPGRRMPLYESPCGECDLNLDPTAWYYGDDTLRLIQAWIDGGAQM